MARKGKKAAKKRVSESEIVHPLAASFRLCELHDAEGEEDHSQGSYAEVLLGGAHLLGGRVKKGVDEEGYFFQLGIHSLVTLALS